MHTINLRKVAGSRLRRGDKAALAVQSGRLIGEPLRPRHTLGERLAQCNPKASRTKEEREWLDDKPAGGELV